MSTKASNPERTAFQGDPDLHSTPDLHSPREDPQGGDISQKSTSKQHSHHLQVAEAIAAAAKAIQECQKEPSQDAPSKSSSSIPDRPWPIDKLVNDAEFAALPGSIRSSLVTSADFSNGLTYIPSIEPKFCDDKHTAFEYIEVFADSEGFAVSYKQKGDKYQFSCNHDKVYTQSHKRPCPDDEVANPHSGLTYDACPFNVAVSMHDGSGVWAVNVVYGEHNHGPVGRAASAKKRRYTYFQKTLHFDNSHLKLTDQPLSSLEKSTASDEPESSEMLKGLVGALTFDNALLEDQLDEHGNVTHLFWTSKDCVDMLQQFPEVLFINTSKSPGMPVLVHITGITAFNTTFEVGYAFINSAGLDDFRWVLYCLKDVMCKHLEKDYTPSAVITYRDPMLLTAVDHVFENTSQICVTQLMLDVHRQCDAAFETVDDRTGFMTRFRELVDSETPDIYVYNESDFLKTYAHTHILVSVMDHWLCYKTKFVRAWADQHMHFNNYSMGKAEAAQAELKKVVEESNGDMLKIYYKIKDILKQKKSEYEQLVLNETQRCPAKYFVSFYDDVRFKVSTHALDMIKEQHEMYLEAVSVKEPLHRCTRVFTTTTGLPCKHTLSRPVVMDDLHPHWWLTKQKVIKNTLSQSDRLANDLTTKLDRTFGIVREHFMHFSSLEAREFMLANMIKYFSKAGVSSVDSRLLNGLPSSLATSHASARATSPVSGLSPSIVHGSGAKIFTHSDTLKSEVEGSSSSLREGLVASTRTKDESRSSVVLGDEVRGIENKADKYGQILETSPITMRRCGKCNKIGHNARTCGQRVSLRGV